MPSWFYYDRAALDNRLPGCETHGAVVDVAAPVVSSS